MSIKEQFIQQYNKSSEYYLIQVIDEDNTSFILYMHNESSIHDLYKNVKLHKNEDILSYYSLLLYNDNVLPDYGHITIKYALHIDDKKRVFSINYKNKKNVKSSDLTPNGNKWTCPPNGGFVCGR